MSEGLEKQGILLSVDQCNMKGPMVDLLVTITAESATNMMLEMKLPKGLQLAAATILPVDMSENESIFRWTEWADEPLQLKISLSQTEQLEGAVYFIASGKNNCNELVKKEKVFYIQESGEPCIVTNISLRNLTVGSLITERLSYELGDIVECSLFVKNTGATTAMLLYVNHMIRDYLIYVPNSLRFDKGEGKVLFQLVRWHIQSLKSGEEARLFLHFKMKDGNMNPSAPLRATYTYQNNRGSIFGPYQSNEVVLEKK
ncbi:hypothetical protein [Bacillus sp. 165]|uniref:hypothetical protein n=1 Tax=Bacillus sp. 165 TaxID=1529117 RepID=UPI001ADB0E3D|nr:hypothetical protein [Bacillus sp. 165]MBO9130370.1 hypothetical protein [Bacillus sp. 165]